MTFSGSLSTRRRCLRNLSKTLKLICLGFALLAGNICADEAQEAAARAIVEGEAKFYQLGQERGTRAAFLEFLADDGIVFGAGPVNGKKLWGARPESGVSLKWQPIFAAMSRSCDLGYTTGPAEWRKNKADPEPFAYAHFVSVWKKQRDGAWKVALDVGIENPRPLSEAGEPQISLLKEFAGAPREAGERRRALEETQASFARAANWDSTAALLGKAADDVRVYREGMIPAVGKVPAGLMLGARRGTLTQKAMGGDISAAGDLAYSYGEYSLQREQLAERGHYLQIWRLAEREAWKLALDFQAPAPPEKKKPAG